jgi:acyl-CoA thioesterase I
MKYRLVATLTTLLFTYSLGAQNTTSAPRIVKDTPRVSVRITDSVYMKSVLFEFRKKWPNNRMINLVFHGHSVPSGYLRAGMVNTFESYPLIALKSLTESFPTAQINCIRTAIGGENSEQGAKRFDSTVLNHKPDVLFIDYALNDRYIGLERSRTAMEYMIKKALEKNIKVVLLTPTPDLNENILSDQSELEKFSNQLIGLASKYSIELIDSYGIFKNLAKEGKPLNEYMSQNNHPNYKGHQLVADEIVKLFGLK